jgi:hypothetical protein
MFISHQFTDSNLPPSDFLSPDWILILVPLHFFVEFCLTHRPVYSTYYDESSLSYQTDIKEFIAKDWNLMHTNR